MTTITKRAADDGRSGGDLGLVFGWAIVCTQDGEPYYDKHGDHIPEEVMFEAALEFMESNRTLKAMHKSKPIGTVIMAWPVTAETLPAFDLDSDKTGLMVAVKPTSKADLQKFRSGEYAGFSIGGEGT